MTENHPITPPPELVQQWINEADGGHDPRWQDYEQDIATRAAQWGADQELEACLRLVEIDAGEDAYDFARYIRAARRPKLSSLKEQALEALAHILNNSSTQLGADTIRHALEQLPE
jgi:predicted GNAT family N-acyltransferase